MSKLDDYISKGIFPIVRTGLSNSGWEIQGWKRKAENIIYECSLCDCQIKPDDWLHTHIQKGYTVPKEYFMLGIQNENEVLGFICKKCYDEIADYDNLYYG